VEERVDRNVYNRFLFINPIIYTTFEMAIDIKSTTE